MSNDDPYFGAVTPRIRCAACGLEIEDNAKAKTEHREWHAEQEKPQPAEPSVEPTETVVGGGA